MTKTTYTIATDAVTETIIAANPDEAARKFAAGEGLRGVQTARDLARVVKAAGGYGTMQDEDGAIWTIAK